MKRQTFLLSIAVLLLMTIMASAASITLEWDPPQGGAAPTNYRIYMWNDSTEIRMVSEVPGDTLETTINGLEPGVYHFVARSYAAPWGESADSNVVSTPDPARPPGNLRIGGLFATAGVIGLVLVLGFLLRKRQ